MTRAISVPDSAPAQTEQTGALGADASSTSRHSDLRNGSKQVRRKLQDLLSRKTKEQISRQ